MKILIHEQQIVGTATDNYTGPMTYITAPEYFTIDDIDKYYIKNGELFPYSTPKELLNIQINEIRYSKIYMDSIPYTFPGDTEPDGIQMRDETDRQNIQDLVIDAMNKNPEDTMYFMPVSNNLKTLTAQDIIDMGQFLKTRGDQIVSYAWTLKAQISAAATIEALNAIDINTGWPA
jgi:hypothetical protein